MIKNDSAYIWVSPEENDSADGSYENPFFSVRHAIDYARPGQTVVLKGGRYSGDVTIQNRGTIHKPLRIMAQEGAAVQCIESCWYFYDVSDVICSGIVFLGSPGMAIAVIGKCERNRFESIKFVNCSIAKENACTLFFGGSGQACNIVESCEFEHSSASGQAQVKNTGVSVGIMITEGDAQQGEANRDHIISKNRFYGYGYGILLGSQDATIGEYGHRVLYNTIDKCLSEGIMIKCGDTLVKGNIVRDCAGRSISIMAGTGSVIEDNRIVDCGEGIRVAGKGHTVSNNCIVRCRHDAVSILSNSIPQTVSASNVIVEQNTVIDWGHTAESQHTGIRIEPGTTCVVRKNLLYGHGRPYAVSNLGDKQNNGDGRTLPVTHCLIKDNLVSGEGELLDGSLQASVSFVSMLLDNYANDSGYGAHGWMLSPEALDSGPAIAGQPPSHASLKSAAVSI